LRRFVEKDYSNQRIELCRSDPISTYKSVKRVGLVEIDETLKAAHCVEPDSEMQVPDMALNPLSRTASCVAGSSGRIN
jgi:hypothetical protein